MTEPTTPAADDGGKLPPSSESDDSLDLPQNLDQARNLRSENKSLRQRMKAAEEAAELANGHLGNMRRTEVERLASEHLVDPADMWTAHPEVDGFLTEDGSIDAGKVTEAAQAITSAKPHLAAPQKAAPPPSDRPIEGLRSGARPDARPTQPTWAEAIRR